MGLTGAPWRIRLAALVAVGLALAGGTTPPEPDLAPLDDATPGAEVQDLSSGRLPTAQATAEAAPCTPGSGLVEILSAARRATRPHADRAGALPLRRLAGQLSRVQALTLTRIGFVRALAEASAGASTQATTLPPPSLA